MKKAAQFPVDFQRLVSAPDYRTFLKIYFSAVNPKTGAKRSYAQFARDAGFLSRSYPRDILLGKRRLTAKTAPPFAKALDIPKDWKELFRLLVAFEEKDADPNREKEEDLLQRIRHLREQLSRKAPRQDLSPSQPSDLVDRLCEFPELPRVYAALRSDGAGTSESEIIQKTRLPRDLAQRCLRRMEELKLAERTGLDLWSPLSFHVALLGVRRNEYFRQMFASALRDAASASQRLMDSEKDLFMASALCVHVELLPKLKAELQEVILKFVDSAESQSGDTIAQLICSLHR